MDNLPPATASTASSVNAPITESRKPAASSRKSGKLDSRQVRPGESAQQHQLLMKRMLSEVNELRYFLKHNFHQYNSEASLERNEIPYNIDTEQLSKHISKCDDLHQKCLKAMPDCTSKVLEDMLQITDFYKESRESYFKRISKINADLALYIARKAKSESTDSDDDGKLASKNMADDIVKNLPGKIDQADETESALILKKVLECFSLYVDPKTKSLKKHDKPGLKLFSQWCELFARSLSKVLDHYQELDSEVLNSVEPIMAVFNKATYGQDNSLLLLSVLNQLNKKGILDPKTSFTGKAIFADHVIKACVGQLNNLNNIIATKAKDDEPYLVELHKKDKFVSQLQALRPYFPEGDFYIEFLHTLVVDHVDHNWFALLYALACCPAETLTRPVREQFSQRLEQYHPQARTMFDGLFSGYQGPVPDITAPDYSVLWLRAFILNKQGEHHRAYEAIGQSESDCLALGLKKPDVRLQLEILRIKLQSQQLARELPGLSPEQLKVMKEQADNLMAHPQAFWTQHEHTLLEQLRAELAALLLLHTPTVIAPVLPSGVRTVKDAPEESAAEGDVAMPALPQSRKTLVKKLCKNLMAGIRGWQGSNRPEPLAPDDSYQVMGPFGKTLSATETMRKDFWNCGIHQLLAQVNAHRANGDIINELSCYQIILADATRKGTIGIYRLTLELSWTIMRYVNGEYGEDRLKDSEKGKLLNVSWQSLKQSVCLAMRRSSPLPEQLSDEELVETVIQWLQCLKDSQAKKEMEFFMRCALGSTAGHIHSFLAELFPGQQRHSDRARFFFESKSRLQPDYQKPVDEEGRATRQQLMGQNQQLRWIY